MGSEVESGLEDILKTLLEQLQAACGIFERIVYKNKNQHRGCSYFQYLLKVRRDLRLVASCFITHPHCFRDPLSLIDGFPLFG
ncbi:unnamed protein product [Linum trigynum]|uniref:Uncharacterized protein n=1 Tax=Linum trigynum TaxID=586398 RepID=A0AAV2CEJ0_9ROSI